MVLKLVDAQPVGGVVEGVDRRARTNGAEGADGRPRHEAALVHAEILADHRIRPDLRVLVEEQRTTDGRLDDPRAGIEPHDAVGMRWLVRRVLESLNENVGVVHGARAALYGLSGEVLLVLAVPLARARQHTAPPAAQRSAARCSRKVPVT